MNTTDVIVAVPGDNDSWTENPDRVLAEIVANSTGRITIVHPGPVHVSDERAAVEGWTVLLGPRPDGTGEPSTVDQYQVIPPEGDCHDCWIDRELAEKIDDDELFDLAGWLRR